VLIANTIVDIVVDLVDVALVQNAEGYRVGFSSFYQGIFISSRHYFPLMVALRSLIGKTPQGCNGCARLDYSHDRDKHKAIPNINGDGFVIGVKIQADIVVFASWS
jgi:hypothetical protein